MGGGEGGGSGGTDRGQACANKVSEGPSSNNKVESILAERRQGRRGGGRDGGKEGEGKGGREEEGQRVDSLHGVHELGHVVISV